MQCQTLYHLMIQDDDIGKTPRNDKRIMQKKDVKTQLVTYSNFNK
jgi:hypothetical protein